MTGRNQGTISHFEVGAGVRSLCSVFLFMSAVFTDSCRRQAGKQGSSGLATGIIQSDDFLSNKYSVNS